MGLLNDSLDLFVQDDVPYMKIWEIERSIELSSWRLWLVSNPWYCIYTCGIYLAVLKGGQRCMKNRKPFQLQGLLLVWNFGLAGFSGFAFLRTLPELVNVLLQDDGLHLSVCSRDYFNTATAFWGLLFVLSKAIELGDLALLVLKNKPLRLKNWLHHNLIFIGAWLGYPDFSASWRWFMVMNVLVHFMVYFYLTLKALNLQTPKSVTIGVEVAQMAQMLLGAIISGYSIYVEASGGECLMVRWHIYLLCLGFMLLLNMYWKHFYRQYLQPNTIKMD